MDPVTSTSVFESIREGVDLIGNYIGLSDVDPRIIAARLIRIFIGFLGIIFILLILWSGFLIMVSGGNDEQIGKARRTFANAIIGLIIIISSYSIVNYVLGLFLPGETPVP